MQDYNLYVTAVNKIFDYMSKLRVGWNNMDNYNYIDGIESFKNAITSNANAFKVAPDPVALKEAEEMEAQAAASTEPPSSEKHARYVNPQNAGELDKIPQRELNIPRSVNQMVNKI